MKSIRETVHEIREEYKSRILSEKEVDKSPIIQFEHWFEEAIKSEIPEVNAMTLATASKEGMPSARIVLLKGFDEQGFTFYTNYLSRKGKELIKNPFASMVFFWPELERQVRIEGRVEKTSKETSEAYFNSRPFESRVAAIISPQSQVVPNRIFLDQKWKEASKQYEGDKTIPKPAHWGGFVLNPHKIEFWQGRPGRLHDRLLYSRMEKTKWKIERLAP